MASTTITGALGTIDRFPFFISKKHFPDHSCWSPPSVRFPHPSLSPSDSLAGLSLSDITSSRCALSQSYLTSIYLEMPCSKKILKSLFGYGDNMLTLSHTQPHTMYILAQGYFPLPSHIPTVTMSIQQQGSQERISRSFKKKQG